MELRDWDAFTRETLNLVLPQELNTTEFANGDGYIQLTVTTHARFLLRYREVIASTMPGYLATFDQNPAGVIGRILDDSGSVAYVLYTRAACIDSRLRMWGQPHFASHPEEGKQICLANM